MTDVNINTETETEETEKVIFAASVKKDTLITAGIGAAVGAAAVGALCYFRNKSDDETPVYYVEGFSEGDVVTDTE